MTKTCIIVVPPPSPPPCVVLARCVACYDIDSSEDTVTLKLLVRKTSFLICPIGKCILPVEGTPYGKFSRLVKARRVVHVVESFVPGVSLGWHTSPSIPLRTDLTLQACPRKRKKCCIQRPVCVHSEGVS